MPLRRAAIAFLAIILAAPGFSYAQTNEQDGIFSCRQGKYSMDVGAFGATASSYVPVADYTVEMNTGYLVYKFCTLDPLIVKMRQAITSNIDAAGLKAALTGNGGNPEYVTNLGQTLQKISDEEYLAEYQSTDASRICSAAQSQARAMAARIYMQQTRNPGGALSCTLDCSADDQAKLAAGDRGAFARCGGTKSLFDQATKPENSTLFAGLQLKELAAARAGARMTTEMQYLDWGNGFFSPQNIVGGTRQITTPGYLIANSLSQILGSGYRQLENATSINHIVGALFSTLSTQILTDNSGGLAALNQSMGGQPSYLDQLVNETTTELNNANKAQVLAILIAAQNTESGFLQAELTIQQALQSSTSTLVSTESNCWSQIVVPAVTAYANQQSVTLKVSTSTAFSDAYLASPFVSTVASTVSDNVAAAKAALRVINELIQQLAAANSSAAIQLVRTRVNSLINQGLIHSPDQLAAEQKKSQDVQAKLASLTTDVKNGWLGINPADPTQTNLAWDGTKSPGIGWCNVNNEATVKAWFDIWRI